MLKKLLFILMGVSCLFAEDSLNLLNDDDELHGYVANFPYHLYQIYSVPLQGKFYSEPHLQDFIKNCVRKGQTWEPYVIPFIKEYARPGTVALDIGSHIGSFTMIMSQAVGETGSVYAFEPQKKIFRELIKNCQLNGAENVICLRYALGSTHSIVEMDKETYPGSEGSTGIGQGGDRVTLIPLDSFNLTNISFIKIDVERSEEDVLKGMVDTIVRNRPAIVIELQGGYLWESAPEEIRQKMRNSIEFLEKLNYTVSRICLHDYLALPN